MMTLLRFLLIALLPLALACEGGYETVNADLGTEPLIERPNAQPPTVHFPRAERTADVSLNKFIEHALDVCARGDYDGFRLLFASAYTPPKESDFQRIWKGVKSVQIVSVHPNPRQNPPSEYSVHAVVQLREPDARDRTQRDAVVAVFREGEEWRLSPAPKEVAYRILAIDSRPADDTLKESAAPPANTSRPSTAPSV